MAVSAREARQVAEEARETGWEKPGFLKELFLGTLRLDLVPEFPHVRFLDRTSRKIAARFGAISSNDDVAKYAAARRLLDGTYTWLETDLVSGLFQKPDGVKAAAPRGAPAEELVSSR